MTWFVFVVMVGMFPDGTHDTYLYVNPTHETLEECQAHVSTHGHNIRKDMFVKFNGKMIDKVYCIEEEKLKNFFRQMDLEKESRKQI